MSLPTPIESVLHGQLQVRRQKLQVAIAHTSDPAPLESLLYEVDAALDRMARGTYGLCEECHDTIEAGRLIADPLVRVCLDHMTAAEHRALEQDLQLAARIQAGLLPSNDLTHRGWHMAYAYRPHGAVSGDYCDLVPAPDGSVYFMLGDVSGKGVAASMLMAHLHAMFRTLIEVGLPLGQLMERASRVFCESTLPTHYATLVCGRATPDGSLEMANAGHPSPVLLGAGPVARVEPTGMPVGMFCSQRFDVTTLQARPGDTLLLCSDGLTETENPLGSDYGLDRLVEVATAHRHLAPADLLLTCLEHVTTFRAGAARADDLTLMAIRRAE